MKKALIVTFTIILLLIALFVCWPDERKLGDNYYYLPKYEAIDVGFANAEAIVYKSKNRKVFQDIKITGDVIRVSGNKDFIVALQKIPSGPLAPSYYDPDTLTDLKYYIISKNTDSVYGPFSKEQYVLKRNELGVSQKLELAAP